MGENKELDLLMAKKMLEMKKRLSQKSKEEPKKETPRDILINRLVDRGEEVLLTAERYYPERTAIIVKHLVELIKSKGLKGTISGGELLYLFRSLGMKISVETKIMVKEDGRLISIRDKLKSSQ
ncbi:MAG: double-stranded DNA-binding protein [archaeon]|nr:double-stranded DNA-binding protein [archaeon]MCP8306471.1 double-stranded DNA-binding protein [archaeon]